MLRTFDNHANGLVSAYTWLHRDRYLQRKVQTEEVQRLFIGGRGPSIHNVCQCILKSLWSFGVGPYKMLQRNVSFHDIPAHCQVDRNVSNKKSHEGSAQMVNFALGMQCSRLSLKQEP